MGACVHVCEEWCVCVCVCVCLCVCVCARSWEAEWMRLEDWIERSRVRGRDGVTEESRVGMGG